MKGKPAREEMTELWLIEGQVISMEGHSWARYLGDKLPEVPCPVRLFRSEAEYQTALDGGEWHEGISVFAVREHALEKIR